MINPTNVHYDATMPLLTVRPGVWSAMMPAAWFENYNMVGVLPDKIPGTKILNIRDYYDPGEDISRQVQYIYGAPAFKRLIADNHLESCRHIASNNGYTAAGDYDLLGGFHELARGFENKATIREMFSDDVPFPPHKLVTMEQALDPNAYASLSAELHSERLVLQHPHGSGSRGTFFADNADEFAVVMEQLEPMGTKYGKLVISRRLEDIVERSLQVCVTATKTYVGPAQAQLVRQPLLVSDSPDSVKFCGGRIAPGLMSDAVYTQARQISLHIAEQLQQRGYRGIFGIDFVVAPGDKLYVLEVNARTTGLTPLLGSIQQNIPYQLLHILELARAEYTVDDVPEQYGSGSFVIIYAQADGYLNMKTGRYDVDGNRLGDGFESGSMLPDNEAEYFVPTRVIPTEIMPNGKAMAYIYSKSQLFDDTGTLTEPAKRMIAFVRSHYAVTGEKYVKTS